MLNLYEILQSVLLTESAVDVNKVGDAIDKKYQVKINYRSNDEDIANGARIIEVYAYGLTKAGNPVIRAFQPYGDTTTSTPNWKFFRLDRITNWETTNKFFHQPASDFYNIGKFNPTGDKSMSVVYKIATFGNESIKDKEIADKIDDTQSPIERGAKKKDSRNSDELYKTDTERGMEKLRKELDNPVYQYTIGGPRKKNQSSPINADKDKPSQSTDSTYKSKSTEKPIPVINKQKTDNNKNSADDDKVDDLYKTDYEKTLERQKELMNNKKFVSPDVLDNWKKEQEKRKNKK